MGVRNEFGSTISLTNLLTVSQLGCEQKKLLGFGGVCRAPLTFNFSQAVWVTPPVRLYGSNEAMLRDLSEGGIQGLVNWGSRLSPEGSASASRIAGMTAIQTQAIFTIEGHDRKFPTRVLIRSTPYLIQGFARLSAFTSPLLCSRPHCIVSLLSLSHSLLCASRAMLRRARVGPAWRIGYGSVRLGPRTGRVFLRQPDPSPYL